METPRLSQLSNSGSSNRDSSSPELPASHSNSSESGTFSAINLTDGPNPQPSQTIQFSDLRTPNHGSRWQTPHHKYNSNGLKQGPFDPSIVIQNFAHSNTDPHWINFCNKFSDFVRDTGSSVDMIERMENLVLSIQDNEDLQTQINRIAQDSSTNCQDAAMGSLIEMEKTILKYRCEQNIERLHQSQSCQQVMDLAFGFHCLNVIEQKAQELGKKGVANRNHLSEDPRTDSEELEVFLYLTNRFGDLLHIPIQKPDLFYTGYVENLEIPVDNTRERLGSLPALSTIKNELIVASRDNTAFAKSLANFSPFQTYIRQLNADDHEPITRNIERLHAMAHEFQFQLNEAPNPSEQIQTIEKIKRTLENENGLNITFYEEDFQSLEQDIEKAKQRLIHGINITEGTFPDVLRDPLDPGSHSTHQQEVTWAFEQTFLAEKVSIMLMKLHNNAERISYFKVALNQATLFLEALDIPCTDATPESNRHAEPSTSAMP